jgi:hypothetical protein
MYLDAFSFTKVKECKFCLERPQQLRLPWFSCGQGKTSTLFIVMIEIVMMKHRSEHLATVIVKKLRVSFLFFGKNAVAIKATACRLQVQTVALKLKKSGKTLIF